MTIIIAGAGIAGLSTAAFCARAGHRVCVFDKAPAPAPVGSGLIVQPTGQAVLRALGLIDQLYARGARLDRLDGRMQGGKRKVLDVRYSALSSDAHGVAIHRATLFEMLHDAAEKAGAALHYGHETAAIDHGNSGGRLQFTVDGLSPQADLIVDALGVRTPLVKRQNCFLDYGALWANAPFPQTLGFAPNILSQRYRGAGCSSGVMPIGKMSEDGDALAAFFWTLRADQFEAWRAAPLVAGNLRFWRSGLKRRRCWRISRRMISLCSRITPITPLQSQLRGVSFISATRGMRRARN
ncbi:MAG: FAD-dependent oxidoreductase [Pseudomonadota bacterium]